MAGEWARWRTRESLTSSTVIQSEGGDEDMELAGMASDGQEPEKQ